MWRGCVAFAVRLGGIVACRVRYLNSAGIASREIPGISKIAEAFPERWLLYASLQCMPKNSGPIEIDAMVVMDDRVLLLEIKDWNGPLTANGDQWLVADRPRGRSAVDAIQMKARKVKSFLSQTVPGSSPIYVDSRVVLTGSSTKDALSEQEQRYILNLAEAESLASPAGRAAHLEPKTMLSRKPWELEEAFERATRNAKLFAPLERLWSGYRVVEEGVVEHPKKLWREHRAELARDPRRKALLRVWSFDRLPPGLNSMEARKQVAEREPRAIGRLEALGSKILISGVLMPIEEDRDEVLTQHDELRRLASSWTTLDRFIERTRDAATLDDRTLTIATLLKLVGELHTNAIAHRDLGVRNIWVEGPTKLSLTGFMACQMPEEGSVGDWLDILRFYPADDDALTAREADVQAVGRLALKLIGARTGAGAIDHGDESGLPEDAAALAPWFDRALGRHDRFADGQDAAEEFGRLLDDGDRKLVDQALLDRHESTEVPYAKWPIVATLHQSAEKHVYRSADPASGTPLVVKIWFQWRRGRSLASDLALMRLLEGTAKLKDAGRSDLPSYRAIGLGGIGAFVVYDEIEGPTWTSASDTAIEALTRSVALLRALESLHLMDLSHGDVSEQNTILRPDMTVALVDLFDFSQVGEQAIAGGTLRPENFERLGPREIDRYAALSLINDLLAPFQSASIDATRATIANELKRDRIELLEPALVALQNAVAELDRPERREVKVYVPSETSGHLGGSTPAATARAFAQDDGSLEYLITTFERELHVKVVKGVAQAPWIVRPTFRSVTTASIHGVPIDADLIVTDDPSDTIDDLLGLISPLVTVVPNKTIVLPQTPDADQMSTQDRALDVAQYWRRLVELEEELQPSVRITQVVSNVGEHATYGYERVGADFDFDPEDQIDVVWPNGPKIGELQLGLTDSRSLVIRHRSSRRLAAGDKVTLAERQTRSSFDRREKAVDRVLRDEAAIPHLLDYFDPTKTVSATDYGVLVEDADLIPYKLNDGQTAAFKHVARYGPVALQQGPPGTGKTRFIAAFVHWLVTKQGAKRVLIASQSHEAVNNATEALLDLYRTLGGGRPSLLRIGSKGLTDRIRPYHTQSLRERYQARFDTAFKHRVATLGTAVGLRRDFVHSAIDIDRNLGRLVRRLDALARADAVETEHATADERRRHIRSRATATAAFQAAVAEILGDGHDTLPPVDALDRAYLGLLDRFNGSSVSDIAKARQFIELAHEWSASLGSVQRNFEEFLAKTRTVVAATCVGVGQTKIRIDNASFDWVIIDEAARCSASELAVPVRLGQRVLMVGDHLQLKPMLDQAVMDILEDEMSEVDPKALTKSDFERAFVSPFGRENGRTFKEQYRMDPAICRLVSTVFYNPHDVVLDTSDRRSPNPAFHALPSPLDTPAIWVDTSEAADQAEVAAEWNKHSFHNPAEVRAALRILEQIAESPALVTSLDAERDETPIGIICMYSAQKVAIEEALSDCPLDPAFKRLVRVDTVDSYQGKENTIIIMSLVRSDPRRRGHVVSPNRCNVALSRARERLFIVGACKVWRATPADEPMKAVVDYFDAAHTGTRIAPAEAL